jgi:hypothetical protein
MADLKVSIMLPGRTKLRESIVALAYALFKTNNCESSAATPNTMSEASKCTLRLVGRLAPEQNKSIANKKKPSKALDLGRVGKPVFTKLAVASAGLDCAGLRKITKAPS